MKVELLSPAGDFERLKVAFLYGADAVYFGYQNYSLRANAKNFSLDDIRNATIFAHSINKKVYVTVNIVFHNDDVFGLKDYLKALDEIGIDAIIASDIIVVNLANKLNVKFEIHLSTQASTLNYESAKFWQNLNVTRIVMAREASREDIKRIKEETGLELECFVHGAMCTSFSGKCVMSNYATNRDANRGGCAQICRWLFDIENSEIPFTMMSKDLNNITNIKDMIKLGVNSFKVEGRMRSIYYIATVMKTYREIMDKITNNALTDNDVITASKILNRVANRESVPQFFNKLPGALEQYFNDRDELTNQDFVGIVKSYDQKNKMAKIEQRNYIKIGDEIEIFGYNHETFTITINTMYNEHMENIEIANHPQMTIYMPFPKVLDEYDMLRIKDN